MALSIVIAAVVFATGMGYLLYLWEEDDDE
jgi:hypothetical protein